MPCTSPLQAWIIHPSLGEGLCFQQELSQIYIDTLDRTGSKVLARLNPPMHINCRKCISCRISQSRQWAIRMQHEAKMHDENCFITLTMDDHHLLSRQNPWTLDLREQQTFFKRLRKAIAPQKVRFFFCGEYGDLNKRPHYHAILFGFSFPDRKYLKTVNGYKLYTSQLLSSLWPQGFSTIGEVSFESAAYVARYCTKKLSGDLAKEKYIKIDPHTGEFWELRPDYATMSRRPGLGAKWIEKYLSDVYPVDELVVKSQKSIFKMKPPPFYDRYLEKVNPQLLAELKVERTKYAEQNQLDEERLATLHASAIHRFKRIVRDMTEINA